MTFVIGDIHGEISKLKKLINNIINIEKKHQLVFIGDYINKGENSKETLDYLMTLNNSIFLMGNHEYYFLEFIKNGRFEKEIMSHASNSTFKDFQMSIETIKKHLYEPYKIFFDNLQLYFKTKKYFICHAGLDPNYLTYRAEEIPIEKFVLNNRYHFLQSTSLFKSRKTIFGHTGFTFPYLDDFKIGIDTGAVYAKSNPLTAFCIEKEFFINHFNEITSLKTYDTKCCPIIIRKKPYREEQ